MKPHHRRLLDLITTRPELCHVSNRRLGAELHCSERTISRHLATLELEGRIRIERRPPNRDGIGTDPTGRTIIALPLDEATPGGE
jgi:biotin operon repressor